VALWESGKSVKDIAAIAGVTASAIYAAAATHHQRRQRRQKDGRRKNGVGTLTENEARTLLDSGATYTAIAPLAGVTKQAICVWAKSRGIARGKGNVGQLSSREFVALWKSARPVKDIAVLAGVTGSTIYVAARSRHLSCRNRQRPPSTIHGEEKHLKNIKHPGKAPLAARITRIMNKYF
jgi:DNA-binding CsgD family transcriptional regulator